MEVAAQALNRMDATVALNKRTRNWNGAKVSLARNALERASVLVLPGQMNGMSFVFGGAMVIAIAMTKEILAIATILWTLFKPKLVFASRVVKQMLESKNRGATIVLKTNARNLEFPTTIVLIGRTSSG